MKEQVSGTKGRQLSADDTIRDLLDHPAFAGFGRLLLPWDDRSYDNAMRLRNVGSLLPYHSHVDPATVVAGLNHMIDDVSRGRTVFYEFYTAAEKKAQPARSNTGLFFFRGKPGAPFAIIAPGGGFSYVGSVHEGFPYAAAISKQRLQRLRAEVPGRRWRRRRHARSGRGDLLCLSKCQGAWGREPGLFVVGQFGWRQDGGRHRLARRREFGGDDLPRPSAVVMAYTGHSEYSDNEPPTFAVVGEHDGIAPPSVMEKRVTALRRAGTDVEFHRYSGLGHGFGAGIGTSAEGWLDRAIRFWEKSIRRCTPSHRDTAEHADSHQQPGGGEQAETHEADRQRFGNAHIHTRHRQAPVRCRRDPFRVSSSIR